jgi:hypothetical protein
LRIAASAIELVHFSQNFYPSSSQCIRPKLNPLLISFHFDRPTLILSVHFAINLVSQHYPKPQSLESDFTDIPASLGRPI